LCKDITIKLENKENISNNYKNKRNKRNDSVETIKDNNKAYGTNLLKSPIHEVSPMSTKSILKDELI